MKPEIEELIKAYRNPDKANFEKDNQRAELLKQNEQFKKELFGIKNR